VTKYRRLLIAYTSNSRAYLRWLENGKPDSKPEDLPFRIPGEARRGDLYLIYVAGVDNSYVGWGRIETDWFRPKRGGWKGEFRVNVDEHLLRKPVTGSHVQKITGFKEPSGLKVVPSALANAVWAVARGRTKVAVDRAVEGIRTESLSKSRDDRLRLAARQRAKGKCECCLRTFGRKPDDLRRKCLVVHHKKQLKDTDQPRETKLSELAVVCANCHMMIHADPDKALTIAQLQKKLGVSAR
jgi:hypothetical protein